MRYTCQMCVFVLVCLGGASNHLALAQDGATIPPTRAGSREGTDASASAQYAKAADYSEAHAGRAVLIMVDGKVVFERYANGWTATRPHPLASGTKSFTGVLAACAVQDKMIMWDELASDTLTEWKADPRKSKITIRHLLSLSSGLDPSDALLGGRGGSKILGEGATRMKGNQPDAPAKPFDYFKAALDVPALHDPGTKFEYGPSHFYAFGELLQRKLKTKHEADPSFPDTTYLSYLQRRVFDPIGLKVGFFGKDGAGNPNLPGGSMLTAREWAKFGELVRLNGKWPSSDGTLKSVVDADALSECLKPSPTNPNYGLTWWLLDAENPEAANTADGLVGAMQRKRNQDRQTQKVVGPDGKPLTVYMAAGLGKQRLYVIPQYKLVVVRFAEATRQGATFDNSEFLKPILNVN